MSGLDLSNGLEYVNEKRNIVELDIETQHKGLQKDQSNETDLISETTPLQFLHIPTNLLKFNLSNDSRQR